MSTPRSCPFRPERQGLVGMRVEQREPAGKAASLQDVMRCRRGRRFRALPCAADRQGYPRALAPGAVRNPLHGSARPNNLLLHIEKDLGEGCAQAAPRGPQGSQA